ncbi:MAG: ATP-binding protein [Candidatus Sulfotelmatobacter sp.]
MALLALLVLALLIGCGFAFALVLRNRESTVTDESEHHLSSDAQTMARDYTRNFLQSPMPLDSPDQKADDELAAVTAAVLGSERGSEGGFYALRGDKLLGYAFPTHEGPGVKRDIPPIERPIIEDVARRAANQSQNISYTYRGARDVIVFEAAPVRVKGNLQGSAWVMKRLPGLRVQGDLKLNLGVAAFIVVSLICVVLAYLVARDLGAGVTRIEGRLHELERDIGSPGESFQGLAELARIHRGVNQLAESLNQKIEQERGLREQLRHKERLAALGQVAAGVAHELRNPLATLRLRAQMTSRAVTDPSLQQGCTIMLEEISRLDGMVERLLYFAKPLNLSAQPFNLVELVRDCVESKRALVANDSIDLRYELGDSTVTVRGDRAKLRQVLDNVLSNALEAVDSQGTVGLKIHTQDGFAIVECADSGPGIPENIRDKVFDPFFTTRENGTGLGLSIAYEIVQAHSGRIEVNSGAQAGTVVRIHLPVEESAV